MQLLYTVTEKKLNKGNNIVDSENNSFT